VNNRRRFKNYFIEPKFQNRYLGFLVGSALIPVFFTVIIISYFLNENYALLVSIGNLDLETTELLKWEKRFLIGAIVCSFTAFMVAIAFLGLIYSHRIAGVVYKIRKALVQLSQGNPVEVTLREYDEFKDLADAFNDLSNSLNMSKSKKSTSNVAAKRIAPKPKAKKRRKYKKAS